MQSLCPAEVFGYHDDLVRLERERRRERLFDTMAGSLAPHDGGKSAIALDARLQESGTKPPAKSAPKPSPSASGLTFGEAAAYAKWAREMEP